MFVKDSDRNRAGRLTRCQCGVISLAAHRQQRTLPKQFALTLVRVCGGVEHGDLSLLCLVASNHWPFWVSSKNDVISYSVECHLTQVVADRGFAPKVSDALFGNLAQSKVSSESNLPRQLNKSLVSLAFV